MKIFDLVNNGKVEAVAVIPAEYMECLIPAAKQFVYTCKSSTTISQYVAYDVFELWYYVLDIREPAMFCFQAVKQLYPLNFVLGNSITVFERISQNLDLKQGHYQLLRIPEGSYEIFLQPGTFRFVQLELSTELVQELKLDEHFVTTLHGHDPDFPAIYGGLSLAIPIGARLMLEKILHSKLEGTKGRIIVESACKDLIVRCLNEMQEQVDLEYVMLGSERRRFEEIKAYIRENLGKRVTTEQICVEFGISRTRLYLGFMQLYRVGLRDFILQEKMRAAKHLLNDGWQVGEVAERVGYPDASNFIRTFKQQTGITPMVYKQSGEKK